MVTILPATTENPLSKIGEMAGICWNSPIDDKKKNIKRAKDCLKAGHGRLLEFIDIEMEISGYSARVIREWYTHIGGSPTRLQESTRYVDCNIFSYVIPPKMNDLQRECYIALMKTIQNSYSQLIESGVSKEDAANILPLGMYTKIVDKRNLRNLIEMSHQRKCTRAYWEFRKLFAEIEDALKKLSDEWKYIIDTYFMRKCEFLRYCPEQKSCGFAEKFNEK